MKPEIRVKVGDSEMVFRLIVDERGAVFRMGSRGNDPVEEPIHSVRLETPYYLAETPVTQEQFVVWRGSEEYGEWFEKNQELIKGTSWDERDKTHENHFPNHPQNPADSVTWWEALAYSHWLTSQLEGEWYAGLPTEAQWEYACRDGGETDYWNGDGAGALHEVGWFAQNSEPQTQAVGQKRANGKGLYDLHGNVWEWCYDAFRSEAYRERISHGVDPFEPGSKEAAFRVLRGGSWGNAARDCRSAFRNGRRPGYRNGHVGFRLGLFPGPEQQVWPPEAGSKAEPGAVAGSDGTERKAQDADGAGAGVGLPAVPDDVQGKESAE